MTDFLQNDEKFGFAATSEELRAKAIEQGRFATFTMKTGDRAASLRHLEEARRLTLLALEIEQSTPATGEGASSRLVIGCDFDPPERGGQG